MEYESKPPLSGDDSPLASSPLSSPAQSTTARQLTWRSWMKPIPTAKTILISILMFLIFLEIPIVITAAVAITDDIGGLELVGWIVASYLLGYVGVIVIFAKLSDMLGRKFMLLVSAAFFIIFSAACSAAQTFIQVIVFRAFQGIGGGGCYSICTIIIMEIVPPENVPLAAIAFVIAWISIPNGFPYHGAATQDQSKKEDGLVSKSIMQRADIPGAVLLLFATLSLVAGFEEADALFPWRSPYVITLLTASGILYIALGIWERYVTLAAKTREPVLPWRFFVNRRMISVLANQFLLGGPAFIGMFILPQRFQLVYGLSGLDAGIRLIPFSFAIPVATIFAAVLAGKRKIPLMYIFISGAILQIIGFALLGTLPFTSEIPARMYGYEIIAGWGCGMNFSLLTIAIPLVIEARDRAVGMAAGAQFRLMGSTIVLSISTSVFNTHVRSRVSAITGSPDATDLNSFSDTVFNLSHAAAVDVRRAQAEGYNRQTLVLCGAAALQIFASLLLWNRKKQLITA
ncbi:major facilitator superfamily domain-containing protein [Stachybotrys elegans]|uniref:Major facilitator superfamily domain-containing protein n=1 Tax=Stachybotrys elegans TaxID=80388 RepID=A0A8K0WL23_9HYPO|nr:major facilitator superfamily domain-containing protein [Stachybotrys elegans]